MIRPTATDPKMRRSLATPLSMRQPRFQPRWWASLAAGLWGIENKIEPPPACEGNAYRAAGEPLPRNLKDAVARLTSSERARQLLGEGFVDHYVRTREWEVRQFERAVTTWELERYLELI